MTYRPVGPLAVQLAPSSVERNTPLPLVAANKLVPLTTSASADEFIRPLLTAAQLAPSSVERNTPPSVPAYRLVPLTDSATTSGLVRPLLTSVQLAPSS